MKGGQAVNVTRGARKSYDKNVETKFNVKKL
jgi:hypothetical protein